MKICDLTQFYSPLSGGVKRYVHEKMAFIARPESEDEHVLIIPGSKTAVVSEKRSRIYSIASPLLSRATQYRTLLNLRAMDEVIERERPDIIESSDPYQVGWWAIRAGRRHRIPVVAFYHSHFAQAYLRKPAQRFGSGAAKVAMSVARAYVRNLYNRFERTLVPSVPLADLLRQWGVANVELLPLGVNTEVFFRGTQAMAALAQHRMPVERKLLLYVGRLAPEKNTTTLFEAFALLAKRHGNRFHLLVIGDGQERGQLEQLRSTAGHVTWMPYCTDSVELAQNYRAADLFVHPGLEETFGLVALESQACGTPVVGFRGSHMDGVILHDQTLWATERSAEALAEAIEAMTATDLPSLGAQASALVCEQYAWPIIFDRLFSIYREVCAGYRRGATG